MSLPLFSPEQDPGPSFLELLRRSGTLASPWFGDPGAAGARPADLATGGRGAPFSGPFTGVAGMAGPGFEVSHATTVVALRYTDGVVMAGDRRATEGFAIAHRSIEKVFPADRFSAVATAGAAGPAIEMIRLFQTQLEHYEKVEGLALSLEGKANQLAQMVRGNLAMAMQGLAVVPLFAGFDTRRQVGRIFTYDVAGGRYEEADHHATGSGGRDARTTIKLGYREGLARADALDLAILALYEAADEDAATGGPDVIRGIYPTVATVTATGFERVSQDDVGERFQALIATRTARGDER
ncbi:MAG: proteasome subunit beta [Acidimicrobiales bacterium]|nr:proteasome subunit beta [Acidimicrobiales bacterium]